MRAILTTCLVVVGLTGCQMSGGQGVEGNWASDDGVFIATFQNGAFSSRLTGTGETVVADGRYGRNSGGLQLEWTSIAANERRAADCRFLTPQKLSCTPTVGQTFTMTKVV
ncbi:hypothetical protein [Acuticoccus kandeliae]|uniref:hypothetical protein n=1 Tax=Acuticoccus kandeliae TaxID=2073160 RepID=UPI0013008047|nr:hypothetical protein [Acuticoccus kandeliae]